MTTITPPSSVRSHAWFSEARFGIFIHWGPYSEHGRGEQVLFREHLDPAEYERQACAWNPADFDPKQWAATIRQSGAKYAVLTTRHHDGYCLWDSKLTDYTSAAQAPRRDFVREYVDAMRAAGLRVGLYYSLADWRIPAYWEGPDHDPAGWTAFCDYVHGQVRELMTHYGKIDVLWFDGAWPHTAQRWRSKELVKMIRQLQPDILINNRLGATEITEGAGDHADGGLGAGESATLGDFGTPEHHITADTGRIWESCQTSTWRLWCYSNGERWRPADLLLDFLTEAASKGGNLLLNVGPESGGALPAPFIERMKQIGRWMDLHGECIYDSEQGDVLESVTYGRQIVKGEQLYLVLRFWPGTPTFRIAGLANVVRKATLLTTGQDLKVTQANDGTVIHGLPVDAPTHLFPVIRLDCIDSPAAGPQWARERLWSGDPRRMTAWANQRGSTPMAWQSKH